MDHSSRVASAANCCRCCWSGLPATAAWVSSMHLHALSAARISSAASNTSQSSLSSLPLLDASASSAAEARASRPASAVQPAAASSQSPRWLTASAKNWAASRWLPVAQAGGWANERAGQAATPGTARCMAWLRCGSRPAGWQSCAVLATPLAGVVPLGRAARPLGRTCELCAAQELKDVPRRLRAPRQCVAARLGQQPARLLVGGCVDLLPSGRPRLVPGLPLGQ